MGDDFGILEAAGVAVRLDAAVRVGSLRYFDAGGEFAVGLGAMLGGPIPAPLRALRRGLDDGADVLLAWRSPTETWVVGDEPRALAALERHAAGRADGCFVELTGGIVLLSATGNRAESLLARLGAISAIPQPGEALTARFADLCATAVCLKRDEILLFVERVHVPHLWAWIRATLADWPAGPAPVAAIDRLKAWDGSG